jgi:hypothetical protein
MSLGIGASSASPGSLAKINPNNETEASLPGYSIIGPPTRPGGATKQQTTKDAKDD